MVWKQCQYDRVVVIIKCIIDACWLSRYGDDNTFDTGLLSLSLVYSYSLTTVLQWSMNSFIDVEKNFTAVERLLHYESSISKAMSNKEYRLQRILSGQIMEGWD